MPFLFRSPFKQVSGPLTVANGGTGASNSTTAKANLQHQRFESTLADDVEELSGAHRIDIGYCVDSPRIIFEDDGATVAWEIDQYGDLFRWYTDANLFMSLTQNGPLTLTYGQIKFPASQSASSDANTLDDYEETDTTPTPTPSAGSITSASSSIRSTKIGRAVMVHGTVTVTTNGTGSGVLNVTLPYTAGLAAAGQYRENAAVGVGGHCYINSSSATLSFMTDANAYPVTSGYTLLFSINYTV